MIPILNKKKLSVFANGNGSKKNQSWIKWIDTDSETFGTVIEISAFLECQIKLEDQNSLFYIGMNGYIPKNKFLVSVFLTVKISK